MAPPLQPKKAKKPIKRTLWIAESSPVVMGGSKPKSEVALVKAKDLKRDQRRTQAQPVSQRAKDLKS